MPSFLREENNHYYIDCQKAVWASDEIHQLYHSCGLADLLPVDFVVETEDILLLIEYKNANIPEAREHATEKKEFDPFTSRLIDKVAKKFYGSLHYVRLLGKDKPVHYVFVVEYPAANASSRRLLRASLKKRLPFDLQQEVGSGIKLIDDVSVLSISEWNAHETYGQYPILPITE